MYCPKCGKMINDTNRFCVYCGEQIYKDNNKKPFEKVILLLLTIVFLFFGGIAGRKIYIIYKSVKFIDIGIRYMEELNYDEAIISFQQAIKINPEEKEAYLLAADAYAHINELEDAIDLLEAGSARIESRDLEKMINEFRERKKKEEEADVQKVSTSKLLEKYGVTEEGCKSYADAVLSALNSIVEQGTQDQYANDIVERVALANWERALLDIGIYQGMGDAEVYIESGSVHILAAVKGSNSDAVTEIIMDENLVLSGIVVNVMPSSGENG